MEAPTKILLSWTVFSKSLKSTNRLHRTPPLDVKHTMHRAGLVAYTDALEASYYVNAGETPKIVAERMYAELVRDGRLDPLDPRVIWHVSNHPNGELLTLYYKPLVRS